MALGPAKARLRDLDLVSERENLDENIHKPLDRLSYIGRHGLPKLRLCGLDPNKIWISFSLFADYIDEYTRGKSVCRDDRGV